MEDGYRLDYWRDRARSIYLGYDDRVEAAHSDEDDLLAEFIEAIADDLIDDAPAAARVLVDELLSKGRAKWFS